MKKTDIIDIKLGKLQGYIDNGIKIFKGVPYAEPPIGELRFNAPKAKENWTGVLEAFEYGPDCPQGFANLTFKPAPPQSEEKCLTLNVWTPGLDDKKRPVMFWIHGGSFKSGGSRYYNGINLSKRGDIVIVVINYRLASLGFFHEPETSGYTPNVALLDAIEALRWVKENIAYFGGDPNNVTVFGESAGAALIATLIGMPAAQRLFHKMITESGSCSRGGYQELRVMTTVRKLMSILGLEKGDIDGFRKIPFEKITMAQDKLDEDAAKEGNPFIYGYSPIIDGKHLPKHPLDAILNGEIKDKPILAGTNLDEMALWDLWNPYPKTEEELFERVNRSVSLWGQTQEKTTQIINLYKKNRSTPRKIACAINTDVIFRIPTIRLLETYGKMQNDTYMYLFTYPSPVQNGELGVLHFIEIPFVFGTLGTYWKDLVPESNEETEQISLLMQKCWISFAKTGNPNNNSAPEWPSYNKDRATMVFGKKNELVYDPAREEREIWNDLL